MPTDPDEFARLRARYEEVKAMWNPSFLGSTHDQRMQWWKLGKERGWLRRRIEAAEREESIIEPRSAS
jgi:hypothetical protein